LTSSGKLTDAIFRAFSEVLKSLFFSPLSFVLSGVLHCFNTPQSALPSLPEVWMLELCLKLDEEEVFCLMRSLFLLPTLQSIPLRSFCIPNAWK
jgi:hypothetical protein